MKISEATIRRLIREELIREALIVPNGFTKTTDLELDDRQALQFGEPGTFAINNNTIAAIDGRGHVYSWIPKEDSDSPRAVSFDQAVERLKASGFTKADFNVPGSN